MVKKTRETSLQNVNIRQLTISEGDMYVRFEHSGMKANNTLDRIDFFRIYSKRSEDEVRKEIL